MEPNPNLGNLIQNCLARIVLKAFLLNSVVFALPSLKDSTQDRISKNRDSFFVWFLCSVTFIWSLRIYTAIEIFNILIIIHRTLNRFDEAIINGNGNTCDFVR